MKRNLLILSLFFLSLSLWADDYMLVWQEGKVTQSYNTSDIDSLTFVDYSDDNSTILFEVTRPKNGQLTITTKDNTLNYIWVATSDKQYAYYGYNSYSEAWQATVSMLQQWGDLSVGNDLSQGTTSIDLTYMFDPDNYTITIAGWDGTKASTDFYNFSFTLTQDQIDNPDAVYEGKGVTTEVSDKPAEMYIWQKSKEKIQLLPEQTDSISFRPAWMDTEFKVTLTDITNVSVKAKIEPTDENCLYFADFIAKQDADNYEALELADLWLLQCRTYLPYYYPNSTLAEAYLYKGTKNITYNEGLIGNTDYYFICFAVDTTSQTVASNVSLTPFTTEITPKNPDLTFNIAYNNQTYIITITPSDNQSTYYWGFFSEDEVSKAGSKEKAWQQAALQYGSIYAVHGKQTLSAAYQAVGTGKHYLIVGGWDGGQTTTLTIQEYEITEDMLPF